MLNLDTLVANSREITDAEIAANRTDVEAGDTVRYPSKRTNWIVGRISGDAAEVYTFCGYGGRDYRSHTVSLARVELVRKGNRIDDGLRAMGHDSTADLLLG